MQLNENASPLQYYHDSWWKVASEPIWYLAGVDTEKDRNLSVGWYFNDIAGSMNGPFDSRERAKIAYNHYSRYL